MVPYCPASSPDCDASHKCSAVSGSVLLKTIVVTTTSCVGCKKNKEGIHLALTGVQDYIKCETNTLDHADTTDFSPSQIGNFNTNTDDKAAMRVHSGERWTDNSRMTQEPKKTQK